MTAGSGGEGAWSYLRGLPVLTGRALGRLVRTPVPAHRAAARRRLGRQLAVLLGGGALMMLALMIAVDVPVISMMPPRGAPQLWWVRIVTEFGKPAYVLWALGAALLVVVIVLPAARGALRLRLAVWQTRIALMFVSVLFAVLTGEVLKVLVGRGRPFVGGKADAFHFAPLNLSEAYASLPSGHATTATALAVAVAAIWPRLRGFMVIYVLIIFATRIALAAHHPSDVIAGALVGASAALVVRHWFAVRRLGFDLSPDGRVMPAFEAT